MWNELYQKLNNSDREEFRRLLNLLLSRTFIIRDVYDSREGMMKINPEYRFVERNYELFIDYLSYAGWILQKDGNYGVIALGNEYEYNRLRLDKNTTLILYTLRLIFEEEREKVSLRNEILTTTGQMVHKMITLGITAKKPSDKDLADGLRQLSRHNIIEKIEGRWEQADTKLLILPSILFVITNEKISRMYETLVNGENVETDNGKENDSEDDLVIRGDDVL
jgi:hypothetical protein